MQRRHNNNQQHRQPRQQQQQQNQHHQKIPSFSFVSKPKPIWGAILGLNPGDIIVGQHDLRRLSGN